MKDFGIQARMNLEVISNCRGISAVTSTGISPNIETTVFNPDDQLKKKAKST